MTPVTSLRNKPPRKKGNEKPEDATLGFFAAHMELNLIFSWTHYIPRSNKMSIINYLPHPFLGPLYFLLEFSGGNEAAAGAPDNDLL